MNFSIVIAIVDEEIEDRTIDIAKANGAGGVTLLKGRGLGLNEKITFFGLTYERSESVLLFIMEKNSATAVIKAVSEDIEKDKKKHGLIFSMPIENLAGIPHKQLEKFKENINEI